MKKTSKILVIILLVSLAVAAAYGMTIYSVHYTKYLKVKPFMADNANALQDTVVQEEEKKELSTKTYNGYSLEDPEEKLDEKSENPVYETDRSNSMELESLLNELAKEVKDE